MLASQLVEEQARVEELRSELRDMQERLVVSVVSPHGTPQQGQKEDTRQPLGESETAASLMGDAQNNMEAALEQKVKEVEARLSVALQAERDVSSSLRGQLQLQRGHNEMLSQDITDLKQKLAEGGKELAELVRRLGAAESERDAAAEVLQEHCQELERRLASAESERDSAAALAVREHCQELERRLASAESERDAAVAIADCRECDRLRGLLDEARTEAEDARQNLAQAHGQLERQQALLEEASSRTAQLEEDLAMALQQVICNPMPPLCWTPFIDIGGRVYASNNQP